MKLLKIVRCEECKHLFRSGLQPMCELTNQSITITPGFKRRYFPAACPLKDAEVIRELIDNIKYLVALLKYHGVEYDYDSLPVYQKTYMEDYLSEGEGE